MDLMLKNVRLAFPNLFEPRSFGEDDTPARSASFILPPDHPQAKEIEQVLAFVAEEKWKAKGAAMLKQLRATGKTCLRNGDDKADYDGFAGNFYVSARSTGPVLVIDQLRNTLTKDSGKPYAGCYVNAKVEIWAQDNKFGKRVNATLKGVQFLRDGDAFAGGAPAKQDDFEEIADTGSTDADF